MQETKESRESATDEGWRISGVYLILIIVLGAAAILFLINTIGKESSYQPDRVGDEFHIDKSKIDTSASFISYDSGGVKIKYFAVVGSDKKIHVALDACDVCFDKKRGYTQRDNVMHCNNCGQEFAINGLGTENLDPGCWPGYLPVAESSDGDTLIVTIADLEAKKFMFV
ncbi:MAG: Fe-S-containing protein [Candidatus Heimdallarchaeota archaeon]